MMLLIQTIALLCQVDAGNNYTGYSYIDKNQLSCQQYYMECTNKKPIDIS